MRTRADAARIRHFLEALGQAVRGPGGVHLAGGTTAALLGWYPAIEADDFRAKVAEFLEGAK